MGLALSETKPLSWTYVDVRGGWGFPAKMETS